MFLYLKTGGGHLAPARAVANYIDKNYNEKFEAELVDGFEKTNAAVKAIIVDGYRLLQSHAKMSYQSLYAFNKVPFFAQQSASLVSLFTKPYIEEKLLESRPAKILIFHFFLIDPVIKIVKKHSLDTEIQIAVTDPFTAHPIWFLRKNCNFILFSERLKNYVATKNIPLNKLNVFPFVLNEKFSRIIDKNEIDDLKVKYKLTPGKKMLLIMGGGDGIPKGEKIIRQLAADNTGYEIVLVAGKNKNLYNKANKLKKELNFENLKIFGFVDFVYELLNMSHAVITKCGASTIMEIILQKKIPIIIDYLWEQEKGNVEFIVDNGMGIFERNIARLPALINKLFTDEKYYDLFIKNIEARHVENGIPQVAAFICGNK
jgi:processive 1,2-diacylglycerol beta-glucosyltransferase/1,2-diacylglycerol 3-beta-galactosyltransferase